MNLVSITRAFLIFSNYFNFILNKAQLHIYISHLVPLIVGCLLSIHSQRILQIDEEIGTKLNLLP